MFPKKKVYKNKNHLDLIRSLPCMCCGKDAPSDPHHVKTVKSGGSDHLNNLLSLCRLCHRLCHDMGRDSFLRDYGKLISKARKRHNLPPLLIDSNLEDQ